MTGGEDWLFRPVVRSLVSGESLINGAVDLEFIAQCNEALDVQDENEQRFRDAIDRK